MMTTTIEYERQQEFTSSKGTFAKLELALVRTFETWVANGHRILLMGDQVYAGCAINRPRLFTRAAPP